MAFGDAHIFLAKIPKDYEIDFTNPNIRKIFKEHIKDFTSYAKHMVVDREYKRIPVQKEHYPSKTGLRKMVEKLKNSEEVHMEGENYNFNFYLLKDILYEEGFIYQCIDTLEFGGVIIPQ